MYYFIGIKGTGMAALAVGGVVLTVAKEMNKK